jgi:hypothetical protein
MAEKTHIEEKSGAALPTNPAVHHEKRDVSVRLVAKFGLYLGTGTALSFVLMWALFGYLEKRAVRAEQPISPLATERRTLPPEPRLQLAPTTEGQKAPVLSDAPIEEMKRMRQEEQRKLDSYGWVDKNAGIVSLPIEEAKRLALEKGFPVRSEKESSSEQ